MTSGENLGEPHLQIGGVYDHYSGTSYMVDGVVVSADGYEQNGTLSRDVIYTQLSDGEVNPAGTKYSRPEDEFLNGNVEIDGEEVPIFTLREEPKPSRQDLSRLLFGRTHRIDTWSAIMTLSSVEPHTFRAATVRTLLGTTLGIPEASSQSEIKILEKMGMIEELPYSALPQGVNTRYVYYRRIDSPFWAIMRAAVEAAELLDPSPNSEE